MDLRNAILSDRSKDHFEQLAKVVAADPNLFKELWSLVQHGESPLPQHGSWLLEKSALNNLQLVDPYLGAMITHLSEPNHNAVHRNLSKIIAQIKNIPEEFQGSLYSLCIDRILSPPVHVAIKVHSMTIAYNIAKEIPELREELAIVLQDQMEYNTAGFKSRGKKILKALKKSAST